MQSGIETPDSSTIRKRFPTIQVLARSACPLVQYDCLRKGSCANPLTFLFPCYPVDTKRHTSLETTVFQGGAVANLEPGPATCSQKRRLAEGIRPVGRWGE